MPAPPTIARNIRSYTHKPLDVSPCVLLDRKPGFLHLKCPCGEEFRHATQVVQKMIRRIKSGDRTTSIGCPKCRGGHGGARTAGATP